jgi:hypothetical protein
MPMELMGESKFGSEIEPFKASYRPLNIELATGEVKNEIER